VKPCQYNPIIKQKSHPALEAARQAASRLREQLETMRVREAAQQAAAWQEADCLGAEIETSRGLEVARQEAARQDAVRLRDEIETMRILGL
jgi:hypothetical protein